MATMRLLAHHPLDGFGNCGEGMAIQRTRDRRVLWIAHESQPKNVTAVDVTNPKKPSVIVQTALPHDKMRSNSLDLVGDLLVVAYQTREAGMKPAGFEIFDVADPANNTNVYPRRPDRAYVGYIDGGALVLDIADKAHPRLLGRWDYHPPFPGFCHTVVPFFDKSLLVVSDESVREAAKDWPKLVWIVDAQREDKLVPISTCPLPPVKKFAGRGGRFGAHNLHENRPGGWISEDVVVGTFFNGGVRAFDVRDPFQPKEIAAFVPPGPRKSPTRAIQLNDVLIDERSILYTVDRIVGGLYILDFRV